LQYGQNFVLRSFQNDHLFLLFSLFKVVVVDKHSRFLWKTAFSSFFSRTWITLKGVGKLAFLLSLKTG
jgi:hypothetical protein